jgi:2-isopropylmalate synthase
VSTPRYINIFDTTLRDGEQAPGATLNKGEKLEIARQLSRLGVDIIEAGFPIASPDDFDAVKTIAREVKGPRIAGLSRAIEKDIHTAWNAVKVAEKPRIHTFISTSAVQMKYQIKKTPEEVLADTRAMVSLARDLTSTRAGADVEFSAMDASRSEPEFLARVLAIAVESGATTINVPDTVGYALPMEFGDFIRELYRLCPSLHDVCVSVHCHNDLGLATANSLAAVRAGATQVECAVNGIGERAGNTSLEEVVMAIRTRGDSFDCTTGVETTEIARTSRLVSTLTGYVIQRNKAIVGRNAFAHEAGIHQHGVLSNPLTYEIMDATSVGLKGNSIVLGKHSGRHALDHALKELGYELDRDELNAAFARFKDIADLKGRLSGVDLEALVSDELRVEGGDSLTLDDLAVATHLSQAPHATVTIVDADGTRHTGSGTGDGPVNALMHAIDAAIGSAGVLLEYQVSAVTSGTDALGEARVVCEIDGRNYAGQGVSTDVLEATAIAYLRAVDASRRASHGERVMAGGV